YVIKLRELLPKKRIALADPEIEIETGRDANIMNSAIEHSLSKREKEVLQLMVTGRSNPEIANTLCRSLGTVKIHVHNIYKKLGVTNRINAINKYHQYAL